MVQQTEGRSLQTWTGTVLEKNDAENCQSWNNIMGFLYPMHVKYESK